MKESDIIVANQGYFGVMYITYLGLRGSLLLGTVRMSDGAFFPPNLKQNCEKLTSEGAAMRPLAQSTIGLARKPASASFV